MKHRPQLPDESVNVGNSSPLRELLRLGSAVIVIGASVYIATGFLVDIIVHWLPDDTGKQLRPRVESIFRQQLGDAYNGPREEQTRAVFSRLIAAAGLDGDDYRLLVIDNTMVNALAGPAHIIAIMRGLLDASRSENELAMVLAHELGHVQHKDPLSSLGRGVIVSGLAALVLGNGDALNNQLIMTTTLALDRRYSRQRELAADRFAVSLVCRVYNHSGGVTDFFDRHRDDPVPPAFFSTHPTSARRIEQLKKVAESLGCPPGDPTPLLDQSGPRPPEVSSVRWNAGTATLSDEQGLEQKP